MKYTLYLCWGKNLEQNYNGSLISSQRADDAAEDYADLLFKRYDGKIKNFKICVREANNHYAKTYTYDVKTEIKPTFYVTLSFEEETNNGA